MSGFTPFGSSGGGSISTVLGPGSATDNAVVRFDGTTGTLVQNSNAILDDTGNLALAGALTYNESISAKTTDYPVVAADSGKVFTNEGAVAQVIFTLPTAVAGRTYTFCVHASQNLRVLANTGDILRISASGGTAAGFSESSTVGSVVKFTALNATDWFGEFIAGTWSAPT